MLSTLLEVAGIAAVVVAGFMVAPVLGVFAAGVALIVLGFVNEAG